MLRAGLTGSIAVGKSFVSSVLTELGCHVLDADRTAREVVAPGSLGLRAVVEAFGSAVLQPDGTLDRGKLGAIVFGDETKRARLNAILHPLIISAQDEWLQRCEAKDPQGIGIVDAALMIESGSYKRFDKLIVVHCRPELQLERLVKRDGLTVAEAGRRIAAQMPQEEKKKFADYLIDTSNGFDEARAQTRAVYEKLKALATSG
jgi:dephospho-CoA kinase